ncbi:MAG: ABC transporter ATP-binding protein [Alphaproteobacteria bacterium]|nr:ABC transporter ATP-binding protein [Alphaproteobacteria bacterium]
MSGLSLIGVGKSFGALQAVADVDLEIPHGTFVCLLGPSGCGKTTLLRLIAGLEAPTRGEIRLDGKDLTHVPAHQRGFGMVFQSLALFPHLNVADNIGYPLRIRGTDAATREKRVEELLDLVQLPGLGARSIAQLSGGQRQRVAIARALALDPALFLLDEPLSALDANLRETMQVELRQLQQRLGVTTIVVTHDQREAMTMADIVVVMEHGRVHQAGDPLAIYRQPANTFVADFIGTSNLIHGTVSGGGAIDIGGPIIEVAIEGQRFAENDPVAISIRPEEVHILAAESAGRNQLAGRVSFIRDVGASVEITVDCDRFVVLAITPPKSRPAADLGDTVIVELPAAACVVLPR